MAKTREVVIQELLDGSYRWSYSKLSRFLHSPRAFLQSATEDIEPTPAMKFGIAFHEAILEPDKFEAKYLCPPDNFPSNAKQRQLVEAFAENNRKRKGKLSHSEVYASVYSVNGKSEDAINKAANDFLADWKDAINHQMIMDKGKHEVISQQDYELLMQMKNAVYNNAASRILLDGIEQTEVWVDGFEVYGLNFCGKIDAEGSDFRFDLKKCASAEVNRFERDFWNNKYDIQAASYDLCPLGSKEYYIMAVDPSLEVSVHLVGETAMEMAHKRLRNACEEVQRCINQLNFFDAFDQSQDFWSSGFNSNGFNTLTPPGYLKIR